MGNFYRMPFWVLKISNFQKPLLSRSMTHGPWASRLHEYRKWSIRVSHLVSGWESPRNKKNLEINLWWNFKNILKNTIDLPQIHHRKSAYGCYRRHDSYGRFCGKSIIEICLWLILPTSGWDTLEYHTWSRFAHIRPWHLSMLNSALVLKNTCKMWGTNVCEP